MPQTLHNPTWGGTMTPKKIIHFNDEKVFFELEEQAIDGQLDYDDYPPEEYRYFSKLSKLGYKNRHNGWSKELCEQKQEEYRKEYRQACTVRDKRISHMKRLQADLIRTDQLSRRLHTARDRDTALSVALDLLAITLNDPDLPRRIATNLQEEIT